MALLTSYSSHAGGWALGGAFDGLDCDQVFGSRLQTWNTQFRTHYHSQLGCCTGVTSDSQGELWVKWVLVDRPMMVCLVRASWLFMTFCSFSCPSWSEWVSLKWSRSAAGFFQSTSIESSVWPSTRIPSTPDTSGRRVGGRQAGRDGWMDRWLGGRVMYE